MSYENLINVIESRKDLEAKISRAKKAFEDKISIDKAQLDDLLAQEEILRKEILLSMKEDNLEIKEVADHKITRNVRITNQVDDIEQFATAVANNKDEINNLGVSDDQIEALFANQMIITDKKLASNIINNYQKVNGRLLDGVLPQITEFITVI